MNPLPRLSACPTGRRPVFLTTGLTVAALAAMFLSACSQNGGRRPPQTVAVTVDTVRIMDVPVEIHGIGTVEAFNTVSVRARVGGEIKRVYFREGQDVQKGDRLFLIDQAPYEAALRQAEANLPTDLRFVKESGNRPDAAVLNRDLPRLERKALDAIRGIEQGKFPSRPECAECDFKGTLCPKT